MNNENKLAPTSTRRVSGVQGLPGSAEEGAAPIFYARKTKRILRKDEMAFLAKLCRPIPFKPSPTEKILLLVYLNEKIIKQQRNGIIKMTYRGANLYMTKLDKDYLKQRIHKSLFLSATNGNEAGQFLRRKKK